MKFKKFRYNLIVFGLVAIIAFAFALPLFTSQPLLDEIGGAEVEDFDPQDASEDPQEEEDEEDEEENDEFMTFKAIDWLNYSLDLLYNGQGFECSYLQTSLNTAHTPVGDVPVTQNIKGLIKRNGKNSLEESYYWSDFNGLAAIKDRLPKCYKYYYVDRDNNKIYAGATGVYDKDAMTYDMSKGDFREFSLKEGLDKFVFLMGDEFVIKTTKNEIYNYKKTNKQVEISVKYKLENVPQRIKDSFTSTGELSNINYKSLSINYVIDAKTGKMKSMTKTEEFDCKAVGMSNTMKLVSKYIFSKVDEPIEFVRPQ